MLKLLKFEMQRTWKTMLYTILGFLAINFALVLKFKSDGGYNIDEMPFQVVIFIIIASAFAFAAVIAAINNLRIEVKKPSRDLYFSLPLSAYSKIGAKVIFSMTQLISSAVIATFVCLKSIEAITSMNLLKLFFDGLKELNPDEMFYAVSGSILFYLSALLVIYLSFAIFRSFFSQVKFGGFITVLIYIALNYIIFRLSAIGINSLENLAITDSSYYFYENILPMSILVVSNIVLFVLTAFLFENKVSFD